MMKMKRINCSIQCGMAYQKEKEYNVQEKVGKEMNKSVNTTDLGNLI